MSETVLYASEPNKALDVSMFDVFEVLNINCLVCHLFSIQFDNHIIQIAYTFNSFGLQNASKPIKTIKNITTDW